MKSDIYIFFKHIINRIGLFDKVLITVFIIVGLIYVGKAWSPSSYSIVLRQIHAKDTGLIWGLPRINFGAEEWSTLTPLIQVSVKNHFKRYNNTSPYKEDLRMFFALPILDWGMLFKPALWLYPLVNPSNAYSFHNYFYIILFIYGYFILFRVVFLFSPVNSLLISLILFFTGATQYWWMTISPIVCIFPWIILTMHLTINPTIYFILSYWILTCWLLSSFYPPLQIPLSFVGFFFALCFKSGFVKSRRFILFVIAGIASILTVFLYLNNHLLLTSNTIYPGLRRLTGGGQGAGLFISNLLPALHQHSTSNLFGFGQQRWFTGFIFGTYYILCTLCFLDYKSFLKDNSRAKRNISILLIGLGLMYMWIYLPIPQSFGRFLLWDRVQPSRMSLPASLILFTITSISANSFRLKFTLFRFIFFSSIISAGWYYLVFLQSHFNLHDFFLDVGIIFSVAIFILLKRYHPIKDDSTIILIICLIFGILTVGPYIPLQSSRPIFKIEKTPILHSLDKLADLRDDKILATPGYYGAILNGLGYKSISHTLVVPQFDFWRTLFPDLSNEKFNIIFNRLAIISCLNCESPQLLRYNEIAIPLKAFNPNIINNNKDIPLHNYINVDGNIDNTN